MALYFWRRFTFRDACCSGEFAATTATAIANKMLITTATAKSDEKLIRMLESGVPGQCLRTTQGRECFGA